MDQYGSLEVASFRHSSSTNEDSRLAILIAMVLYTLVGIEILKQRRLFKSIGNDFVGLDTMGSGVDSISSDHFNDLDLEISLDMLHSPTSKEAKRPGLSLSKSIPELSRSDTSALANSPRSRS